MRKLNLRLIYIYHICILLGLLYLVSCKNISDCFEKTGTITKQNRLATAPFKRIEVYDNIRLVLKNGQQDTILVEAGENLQDKITLNIKDSTLFIKNENTCNWTRSYDIPINVYVSAKKLEFFRSNGFGKINSEEPLRDIGSLFFYTIGGSSEIDVEFENLGYLVLVVNANGTIKMSGQVGWMSLLNFGFGKINLKDFIADFCTVKQEGEGEISVSPVQELVGYIKSVGNVIYYGNPAKVDVQIKGDGKLIKK
jgi:Putative auto-transporter adhesin, head GIN domain